VRRCGEDARLTVGRNFRDLAETGVTQHVHGEIAALVHPAVLGGNRRLANPLLQAQHGFVVALLDFFMDGTEIRVVGGERVVGEGERGRASSTGLEESASVHGPEDNCKGWGL